MDKYLESVTPKLKRELLLAGFSNITDLLKTHQFKSYSFLSELLDGSFPMAIIHIQFNEAKTSRQIIQALNDSLSRYLVEKLPNGWGVGDDAKWQSIRALTNWSTAVETSGELPELSETLSRISHDLLQNPPPNGWSPETHGCDRLNTLLKKHLPEIDIEKATNQAKHIQ